MTRDHTTIEADYLKQLTQLSGRLAEAERHNEFLARVAYELHNPLASAQNALELMRLCPADRLASARARDIAAEQLQHVSRLVERLLSRRQSAGCRAAIRRLPGASAK
jgi:signal transduction histidine kinase